MSKAMPKSKRKRGKKTAEEPEISKNITSDQVASSPRSNHDVCIDTVKQENSQSNEGNTENETKMQHPTVTSSSATEEDKNIPEATDKNGRKIGKHICNICGRAFNAPSRVTRHLIVHTKEKPYKCEICEKPYSQIEILKKHWQTMHKVDFPYKCHSCEKSFIVPSILEWHIKRAHKIKEPTKCIICLKEFARPHYLTKHVELFHALDQAFLCEYCGKIFDHLGQLTLHQKKQCIVLETAKADAAAAAADLATNLSMAASPLASPQDQELLMDVGSDLIGSEEQDLQQDTNTEPVGDEATVFQWGEEKMEQEPGSTNLAWTPDSQTAADGTLSPWKDTQPGVGREEKVDPGASNLPSLWIPESQAWCRVQSATSSDSSSSPVCSGSSTSNISAPSPGLVVPQAGFTTHLDASSAAEISEGIASKLLPFGKD